VSEPIWLSREECLALHALMISQHGGRPGLRGEGLLESALGKPRNLFAYGTPTFAEMAASYVAGVVKGHPFIDGNKRTGFMLGAAFLELNGHQFFATEAEVVVRTLALAAGEMSEAEYAKWMETNSRRVAADA
jgi:death-on-curing protein